VVWVPVTTDSFILPRASLTLLGAGILAGLGLVTSRRPVRFLAWPMLAVAVAAVLSAVTSVAPSLSLTGDYSRYESLPVRLAYLGLLYGAARLAAPDTLVSGYLLGCGVAALEACYQALTGALPRPDGNLGQPNLLGALLAMALALVADRGWQAFRHPAGPGPAITGEWRWLALAPLFVVGLVLSASRSGWLGAAAGVCVVAFWRAPTRWRVGAALATAVVVAAAALALLITPLRHLNHDTGVARVGVWGDAVHLVAARPLTGWGEDATGLLFGQVQSRDWQPGNRFDRAHSLPLDLLITQGVLGLLACAWLFATIWRRLWQRRELAAIAGAMAAYLGWALLNFDWAPATAPLWLLAGCAWAEQVGRAPSQTRFPGWPRVLTAAVLAAMGLATSLPAQAADIASYRGRNDLAVRLDPLQPAYWAARGDRIGLRRAASLGSTDPNTYIKLGDQEREAGSIGAARADYRRALAIYPYDREAAQRLRSLPRR
jgi:O-antigen ligase